MRTDEKPFLSALFGALDARGVSYAVLRNAAALPDKLNGGDIDMLVANEDWRRIQVLMAECASACGGRVVGRMSAPHFVQTEMMGCEGGVWWGCCIDLFGGIYSRSVLPIADERILARRVRTEKGIWTLPEDVGQYLGFVKELVNNGIRSERYLSGARQALANGSDDVLPSERTRAFVRECLNRDCKGAGSFVRLWLLGMLLRHPLEFMRNYGGFHLSRILRYFKPCGKMIAVLGTDGSGKSTLLNAVMPLIQAMTHHATVVHHLKPDLLPPLGRFRGVKNKTGHVCTDPHGSRPSGFLGSLFRLAYLTTDYVFGYWLKVRVKISKTPIGLWVFDRYAYDMLLDPLRFRIALPQWIVRVFLACIPKPDLIVCLGGDPAKIYARKPETSLEEVRRQVSTLRSFADSHANAVWIDTTVAIEESANLFLKGVHDL